MATTRQLRVRKTKRPLKPIQAPRRRIAPLGIGIGAVLVIAGILIFINPPEMVVHHPVATRGQAASEVVSGTRARFYAAIAVAIGAVLVGVSVLRLDK
jgi:cobalamin biosynthesis protein CobD/CbiB